MVGSCEHDSEPWNPVNVKEFLSTQLMCTQSRSPTSNFHTYILTQPYEYYKVKSKAQPDTHALKALRGSRGGYSFISFLKSTPDGGECLALRPNSALRLMKGTITGVDADSR
jgi:hypothetical protein